MLFYKTDKSTVGIKGLATFQHAIQSARNAHEYGYDDRILYGEEQFISTEHPQSIDATELQTLLIQITGRFCEHYANDLICTLSELQAFLEATPVTENLTRVIAVGIRSNGVDGNAFVISRLRQTRKGLSDYVYPEQVYRKLLVIQITETVETDDQELHGGTRAISLIDITHDCNRIAKEDDIDD